MVAADDEAGAARVLTLLAEQPLDADTARRAVVRSRSIDRNDLAVAVLRPFDADPIIAAMILQLRLEMGDAVADDHQSLGPAADGSEALMLQHVGALHAERRFEEAVDRLADRLSRQPDWIAGLQAAARLRWQAGDEQTWDRELRSSVEQVPRNAFVWATWMGLALAAEDHTRVAEVHSAAVKAVGDVTLLQMIAADADSASGDTSGADGRFAGLSDVSDADFDLARTRHLIRAGRLKEAARACERSVARHGQTEGWAWLHALWQALDDPRAAKLMCEGAVREVTLPFAPGEREALIAAVRSLHGDRLRPLGQSPRGGTQTMGHLFKRREPEIVQLRSRLRDAVRGYAARLPPTRSGHPLLGRDRRSLGFDGAWSIRLGAQGHHVPHIHGNAWLSSALYLDAPERLMEDPDRQGWLELGRPSIAMPGLSPLRSVAPLPGRLVLFPAYLWHGTRSFEAGERLTVAFDVTGR